MAAAFFRISFSILSTAIRLCMAFTSAFGIVSPSFSFGNDAIALFPSVGCLFNYALFAGKLLYAFAIFIEFRDLLFELFCVMFIFCPHAAFVWLKDIL